MLMNNKNPAEPELILVYIKKVACKMKTENITGNSGANVITDKYYAVRDAMLEVLPTEGEGLTLDEMVQLIEPMVPKDLFPKGISWYTVTV